MYSPYFGRLIFLLWWEVERLIMGGWYSGHTHCVWVKTWHEDKSDSGDCSHLRLVRRMFSHLTINKSTHHHIVRMWLDCNILDFDFANLTLHLSGQQIVKDVFVRFYSWGKFKCLSKNTLLVKTSFSCIFAISLSFQIWTKRDAPFLKSALSTFVTFDSPPPAHCHTYRHFRATFSEPILPPPFNAKF